MEKEKEKKKVGRSKFDRLVDTEAAYLMHYSRMSKEKADIAALNEIKKHYEVDDSVAT